MKHRTGSLVAAVAASAVAAVLVGGAVAYRQVPSASTSAAVPLPHLDTAIPQLSKTPSGTPSTPLPVLPATPKLVPPTIALSPPTPAWTGPVKVPVVLAKLSKGRAPQLPYLVDREVRGGDGWARKIPGTDTIFDIVRMGDEVLATLSGTGDRLVRVGPNGRTKYTEGITSLVGGEFDNVAYAAMPPDSRGGVVYFERAGSVWKVQAPATAQGLQVLGVQNENKVFYRWQDSPGSHWKLFEWVPGSTSESAPVQVKSVLSADYVSADGTVAGSISDSAPAEGARTCSTVTQLATGKRLWRTCDSWVQGFTPDHSVTIGTGGRGDDGTATSIVAQETATGKVIREWTGEFETVVAEDDQHLLIVAGHTVKNTLRSIIRCDIGTGSCELALDLAHNYLKLSGD
ncbi:hypothetical protein [Streptomyces sp. SID13031]|uniref:hypothetical protein n=1 Tax=Streptomyces sp. SID13031 TaxID=2706046 RepID=UPI0013CCE899|nr:hypothetical protein [Streptomyces sp. SID13031]NEA35551.1 hypothetical protein [Streptomyces sp. SID13031]